MDFNQKRIALQINFEKNVILKEKQEISLTNILGSEQCQDIITNSREFRERIYTPWNTLWMFIKQVISPDKSCKNIVAETIAKFIAAGQDAPSNNTDPYSKARERLPESLVSDLVNTVGTTAVHDIPKSLKWLGKDLKGIDGTTLLKPDTKENQEIFPQQERGAVPLKLTLQD